MSLDRETITTTFDRYASRIRAVVPDAQVELSGSALVPGLDPDDIDLVVLADDVPGVAAALAESFPPLYRDHWDADWAAFRDEGPPQVDVVVTRPGSWGDDLHRRSWQLIAARPELQAEHRALKDTRDGYAERKSAFFERVVAELSS